VFRKSIEDHFEERLRFINYSVRNLSIICLETGFLEEFRYYIEVLSGGFRDDRHKRELHMN
jgi:hypothetical protein